MRRLIGNWMMIGVIGWVCCLGVVAISCAISLVVVRWVKLNAVRLNLIDLPNERKVHTTPIPRGGGLGIWVGVLFVFLLGTCGLYAASIFPALAQQFLPVSIQEMLPGLWSKLGSIWLLLAGGSTVAILGLLDDRFGLDWRVRISIEFGVAAAIVYGLNLHLTAYIDVPWLTPVLSILWIVMLINSFNMLDNMDALSAGVAAIICAVLALMLLSTPEGAQGKPQLFVAIMVLALLGGLLGFLKHNWPPATIFMGTQGVTSSGIGSRYRVCYLLMRAPRGKLLMRWRLRCVCWRSPFMIPSALSISGFEKVVVRFKPIRNTFPIASSNLG